MREQGASEQLKDRYRILCIRAGKARMWRKEKWPTLELSSSSYCFILFLGKFSRSYCVRLRACCRKLHLPCGLSSVAPEFFEGSLVPKCWPASEYQGRTCFQQALVRGIGKRGEGDNETTDKTRKLEENLCLRC